MITDNNRIDFLISQFTNLEEQLLGCMEFIPFVDQNQQVISPKFATIILEACSLIESILKEITNDKGIKYNFKKYAEVNENSLELENTISLFLGSPPRFYQPYEKWTKNIPDWWKSYNKLKHDRLNNYEFGTYETAILSLTGLHQLISKCRLFTDSLIKAGWFNPNGEFMVDLITSRISESGIPITPIACESKLFVSPLNFNFATFEGGEPRIIEECDFSNRVKILLSMSGY